MGQVLGVLGAISAMALVVQLWFMFKRAMGWKI